MGRNPSLRMLAGLTLLLLSLLLFGAILIAATAPAAAQTDENATETEAEPECTEHIDRLVSLCSAEFVNGEAVLEVEADANQRIVLTDAAGVMEGGEVRRQEFVVRGRSTVRMAATEYDGLAAVTIDTGRVLYAVPLERDDAWFSGDPTWETAQVAGAGAATGALFVVGLIAYRIRDGGRREVDRET